MLGCSSSAAAAAAAVRAAAASCQQLLGGGWLLPASPLPSLLHAALAAPQQQPCRCRQWSSAAGRGDGDTSKSSSGAADVDDAFADYQRRVEAIQQGAAAGSQEAVTSWLSAATTAGSSSSSNAAFGGSFAASARSSSRQAAGGSSSSSPGTLGGSSSGSSSGSSEGSGGVSAEHGYAVLGGINPEAAQQVAGAQQARLHPTRTFNMGDMYDPADLSPLVAEEEEAWVPPMRRRPRPPPLDRREVAASLDYKAVDVLLGYVSASGRIKPRRATRLPPSLHHRMARTIKFARHMALLPHEMRVGHDSEGERWKRARSLAAAAAADAAGGESGL